MKAKIHNSDIEIEVMPYYQEGKFVGFSDASSGYPFGVLYSPADLDFPGTSDRDWSDFRREAAKDILCAIITDGAGVNPEHITMAIEIADELIRQLKEEKK